MVRKGMEIPEPSEEFVQQFIANMKAEYAALELEKEQEWNKFMMALVDWMDDSNCSYDQEWFAYRGIEGHHKLFTHICNALFRYAWSKDKILPPMESEEDMSFPSSSTIFACGPYIVELWLIIGQGSIYGMGLLDKNQFEPLFNWEEFMESPIID